MNLSTTYQLSNFELKKTMIKKSSLALVALFAFACGSVSGQGFSPITASDLGLANGATVNGIFDIGLDLGYANDTDVQLTISNGRVNGSGVWTVAEGISSTYTLSGVPTDAFVNHGRNLGSDSGTNGSGSRDGVTGLTGQIWTLDTATLDSDYTFGSSANDYFVDYTGTDTGNVEENSAGFIFRSPTPVTTLTVFSNNTADLDNNYSIGFSNAVAVPEPSASMVVALAGLFFVRRKRS